MDSKSLEYVARSERAAVEIATWPKWMQRNLKPATVKIEDKMSAVDVKINIVTKDGDYTVVLPISTQDIEENHYFQINVNSQPPTLSQINGNDDTIEAEYNLGNQWVVVS